MLIFRGDVSTDEKDLLLTKWEEDVYEYTYNNYSSKQLRLETIGVKILDQEMIKDGKRLTPFFASGFTIVGIFVTTAIMLTGKRERLCDLKRAPTIMAALLCPALAILTSFGLMTLLQMRVNSFLLVMPTLVLGIGMYTVVYSTLP